MQIQKAVRSQTKIKLAITGPSGSGKTYSALRLAKGLGNKILVIDSENGSASLYSELFDFDVINLSPPFSIERYIEALQLGLNGGYDVIVADQISHAWAGEGGLLQQKEKLDSTNAKGSYTNWAKITPLQEKFVSTILQLNTNLIVTMRSKQDYILVENDRGKQEPRKVGMAPIQREGIEYEFTTVFDVAMSHKATVSKDRTGLFKDEVFQITEDTGKQIKDWLNSAVIPDNQKLISALTHLTEDKRNEILLKMGQTVNLNRALTGKEIMSLHPAACRSFYKEYFEGV